MAVRAGASSQLFAEAGTGAGSQLSCTCQEAGEAAAQSPWFNMDGLELWLLTLWLPSSTVYRALCTGHVCVCFISGMTYVEC